MDANVQKVMDFKLEETRKNLLNHQFAVQIFETKEELQQYIQSVIPSGSTVNFGGSMSLSEAGVLQTLQKMDIELQDRGKPGVDAEAVMRQAFSADYYFMSSNAISQSGELYNLDGSGNRVAALIYGPKKVFVVAGINKIVKDEIEGWHRIATIAAPANCIRLNRTTPCTKTGTCMNCLSPERICNQYVKTTYCRDKGRIEILFVKEELGY